MADIRVADLTALSSVAMGDKALIFDVDVRVLKLATLTNILTAFGLTSTDSPTFVTAKFSGLTDGYLPYHVADATGLADSPLYVSGTNIGLGTTTVSAKAHILATTEQLRLGYNADYYAAFTVNSAGSLTIAPVGDLILNPTGNDILPASAYDINIGIPTKKFLSLNVAELIVDTLVANEHSVAMNGRMTIGPASTCLAADLDAVSTTIYTEDDHLSDGDKIVLEKSGQVEFMHVVSEATGSGPYAYTVTRNLDGSGANSWTAGDAILNTGDAEDGFIEMYAINSVKSATIYGPTIAGNIRNSDGYNDWTEVWAIGNLNGLYGYAADIYGAAFGRYSATDYITIDPTNGIRFLDSNDYVQASLLSSVWTMGRVAAGLNNIQITAGAINFRNNTTVMMQLTTDPNIIIGQVAASQCNILISSGAIALRNNTTSVLSITNAGIPTITFPAGGSINITGNGESFAALKLGGSTYYIYYGISATGETVVINPDTDNITDLWFGTNLKRYDTLTAYALDMDLWGYYDSNDYAHLTFASGDNTSGMYLTINRNGTSRTMTFAGSSITFSGAKEVDLADGTNCLDDAYADDWNNVADIPFLDDRDDLAFLNNVRGSGIIDERTGLELVDDNTLPEFIKARTKDGGKIILDADGKPYFTVKAMSGWLMGMMKQMNKKYELHMEQFHSKKEELK